MKSEGMLIHLQPYWVSDIPIFWYSEQLIRSGNGVKIGIYAIVKVGI